MLIVPYLYQSHNYIPIMSPCFRHIPMSSPFYAHQMALNPIDSPEFPKKAPSPVPQPGKRADPALQSLARCARWTAGGRAPWSWPHRDHPKCEVPHIWNGNWSVLKPIFTVLNQKILKMWLFLSHTATTLHHETCGFNQWKHDFFGIRKMVGAPGQAVSNEIPRQWPAKIWWLDMIISWLTAWSMDYSESGVDVLIAGVDWYTIFELHPGPHNKSTWCLLWTSKKLTKIHQYLTEDWADIW